MNLAAQQKATQSHNPSSDPTGENASNIRSPKRKRTDSVRQAASDVEFEPDLKVPPLPLDQSNASCAPPLSTPPQQIANEESHVQGSPRTIVARSFENLTLRGSEKPVLHFGRVEQDVKKARLMDIDKDTDASLEPAMSRAADAGIETPPTNALMSAVPRPVPRQVSRKSPPPPVLSANPTANTPSAPSATLEIDLSTLTWQDSEITGHLALDPDDDLTGMNGIGFKPTPQIAYARTQARRRQVAEWKNREAREARARRAETRRRGMVARGEAARADAKADRVVRFAA